jgi:hypothetical protein
LAEQTGQLEREQRLALPAALAAFVSAALWVAYVVYILGAIKRVNNSKYQNSTQLKSIHNQPTQYLVSTVIEALAVIVMIGALVYLYQAIRARRQQIPKVTLVLAIAAPLLFGIVVIVAQVHANHVAQQFAHHGVTAGKAGDERAKKLLTHAGGVYLGLDLAATLGLAAAFILLSVNGMRAGLLSRFIGVLGIVVGAAQVLLLGSTPAVLLVLIFLIALGLLFLDRWPNGRGPAWGVLEAIPWPQPPRKGVFERSDGGGGRPARRGGATAADVRGANGGGTPDTANGGPAQPEAAPAAASGTHSRSKKRKRKRRG